MKKVKGIALFLVFAMLVSFFGFSPKAFAADKNIKVQFFNSSRDPKSNTIGQWYKVFNTSSSPLDLSTVKLRYYYTQEGNQEQNFWCDHSGMMSGYSYINLTDKVTYKIVKMDKPVNGADSYIEIGFKDGAGSIEAGGSVVIQARTAKTDWSSYNQADDYSFNANSTNYSDWDKVTGYVNGNLESGVEPDGSNPAPIHNDSEVTPTSGTFDKNVDKQADMPVTMTLNGNTLTSIINGSYTLVEGKDYTVADGVVTLSKSYLATLEKGTSYDLVFNFSAGKAATFKLNVVDTTVPTPTPVAETTLNVGTASGKPGEKVVVPVKLSGLSSALGACQFNVNYDPSVLEVTNVEAGSTVSNPDLNFAYKDFSDSKYLKVVIANLSLKAGTNAISGNGDVMYITFTIKANASAETTPVTLSNAKLIETSETVLNTKTSDGSVTITGTPAQKDSVIAPTSGTFDKNADKQADMPVTMTLNGNTLKSIVNGSYTLVESKDYTVADGVVTLSKSYLATLEKGTSYDLVFNFSAGKAATFTLKVEDTTAPTPVTGTTLSIGTLSGKPGEKVVVPVKLSGLSSALGACQFNVNYDPSVLEVTNVEAGSTVSNPDLNFAYKDFSNSKYVKFIIANLSLKSGTNAISGDGNVAYITFTIKANASAGKTSLTLSNAKLIDVGENVVTTASTDGSITVVTE